MLAARFLAFVSLLYGVAYGECPDGTPIWAPYAAGDTRAARVSYSVDGWYVVTWDFNSGLCIDQQSQYFGSNSCASCEAL